MQEFLESNDVAKALDLSGSTIRVLVASGRLRPAARTRRGIALFATEEIQRVAEERRERRERREHGTNR